MLPSLISYVILRIADVAPAEGNCISKVLPDADLSLPKSNTATAALEECESLYIKAPLVVKVAFTHETLLKSTIAVVPLDFGKVEATVKAAPPAVYADPEVLEISLEVL